MAAIVDSRLVATAGSAGTAPPVDRAIDLAGTQAATLRALSVVETADAMGRFDPVVERAERGGEAAVEAAADLALWAGVSA